MTTVRIRNALEMARRLQLIILGLREVVDRLLADPDIGSDWLSRLGGGRHWRDLHSVTLHDAAKGFRCHGAECAPCDAYIIAATRSGIPETLPRIFPGCRVVSWQPVQKAFRGKVKEAAEFAIDWFEKNPEGLLRFNVVQRAIGMESASNFREDIRRHPDFKEALATHDIAEAQVLGDNRRGFLKPSFD
jgi:hypothetical protein